MIFCCIMKTPEEIRDRMKRLASEGGYIEGIYNYCDRWCERCAFTSKCINHAFEPPDYERSEDETFEYLANVFKATMLMLDEMAEDMGIDLSQLDDIGSYDRSVPFSDQLSKSAKETAFEIQSWFETSDPETSVKNIDYLRFRESMDERENDALEVILWYNMFIPVKLERATGSFSESTGDEYACNNRDGSAKVALIGLDRSIAAWAIILESAPEFEDTILNFLIKLSRIRNVTENRFPGARSFIRPGLDE